MKDSEVKKKYIDPETVMVPELEVLLGTNRNIPWSDEDEATILRYYGHVPIKDLAKHLNRTIASVRGKAEHMGLQGR